MALTKVVKHLSSTPSIVDGGNATAITIDSSENVALSSDLKINDNKNLYFGDDNNGQLYYNSSNDTFYIYNPSANGGTIIQNNSAAGGIALQPVPNENAVFCSPNGAVQVYHDGSSKLQTTSSGINVTGSVTTNSGGGAASLGSHLDLGDNQKARFGASDDLQIYHDVSNSYINDTGTGALFLKTNYLAVAGANGNQLINAEQGGAIELYHANAKKLETTSGGITVTGSISGALASAVTATTQSASDNSTKIATTAYTDAAITALVGGAPSTLDTLNEIAASINDDANYVGTVNNLIAGKAPLASPTFTGGLTLNSGHVNIDSGLSYQWGDSHERIEQSDGKIEFFTNNGESMTLSGSNLGIGDVNPTDKLSIKADTGHLRLKGSTTATKGLALLFDHSNNRSEIRSDQAGVNQLDLNYYALDHHFGRNASNITMTLTDLNKVGIGDTAPQDFLEVKSTSLGGITISNSNHNQAALSFARSSTATARIFTTEPDATHTGQFNFQTSNASGGSPNLVTAMVIDDHQNVGIGVTAPSSILDIRGSGNVDIMSKIINTQQTSSGRKTEFLFGKDNGANLSGVLKYVYDTTQASRRIDLFHYQTTNGISILDGGNVGIGTSSIDEKFQVEGGNIKIEAGAVSTNRGLKIAHTGQTGNNTILEQYADGNPRGRLHTTERRLVIEAGSGGSTGTGEKLEFWTNANRAMTIDTSQKVGIGTNSPATSLQINPSSGGYNLYFDRGNSTPGGANPWLGLFNATTVSAATYGWGFYDSSSDGSFQIWGKNNSTTGYNALTIKRGGNVGIGTNAPHSKLHLVETASGAAGIDFPLTISSDRYQADYGVGIAFRPENQSTGYKVKTAIIASGGGYGYNQADLHFCLDSDNTVTNEVSLNDARMTIKKSGNVGIGTTTPNSLLELRKTTAGYITGGSGKKGAVLTLHHEAAWENGYTGGDWLGSIDFSTGDSSTGEGIRASIRATSDNYYNTNSLAFYTANQGDTTLDERMRIKDNGNVGIGTTSPSSQFVVAASNGGKGIETQVTTHASNNQFILAYDRANSAYLNMELSALNFGIATNNGTNRFKIRSDGGVAIGLNNAGYSSQILSVKSGAADNVLYGESTDANCFAVFRDNSSNTNVGFGAIGNDHVFRNDSVEKWRMQASSGYLIGQSASQVRIVLGSTGNSSNNTSNWIRGSAGYLQFNSASSGYNWEINGSSKMAMTSTGALTVENGQTYALTVSGNGAGLRFSTATNQRIYFNTHRAMEGNADGSVMQVAEGYTKVLLQAEVHQTSNKMLIDSDYGHWSGRYQHLVCHNTITSSNTWTDVAFVSYSPSLTIQGIAQRDNNGGLGTSCFLGTIFGGYGSTSVVAERSTNNDMNGGAFGPLEYRYLNGGASSGNYRLQVRISIGSGTMYVTTTLTGHAWQEITED